MLSYMTFILAAVTAVLAAAATAGWHTGDAALARPQAQMQMQMQKLQEEPARICAGTTYLPALFVEQERAARMEPMPPQF